MIAKQSVFQLAKALEGIPVLGALAGSPAARAGLRYGDILLSVNGVRTKTVTDYVEAKALREDGMEVVVFRTGVEVTHELAYDARSGPVDPAAILAELISLRILGEDDEPLPDPGGGETS
jgi:S1-C subfamily serine protease